MNRSFPTTLGEKILLSRSGTSSRVLIRPAWILMLLGAGLLIWMRSYWIARLGNEAFVTGYALLLICFALAALGIRKRIHAFRLGPVAVWQSAHHYLGAFCLFAYVLHAGFMPDGWIESILGMLFWTILGTGFLSWYVNRNSPRLLRAAGPAILRSDIPHAKILVGEQACQLAIQAAGSTNSAVIADYYRTKLADFFSTSRPWLYRTFPTGKKRRQLISDLENLERYLDDRGRVLMERMSQLVHDRDDLDFQSAIQNRMRFCAALHTFLLGAFTVFVIAHVWLAHQYSSHW